MSTDGSVLAMFDEVAEYYPGSRRPIVRHPNRPQPAFPDEPRWDDKPKRYDVGGVEYELFTIGQLSEALGGRKPVTIRLWERTGVIPRATFHRPSEDPRGQRRLYSRQQVEGMVRIAGEEGLLDTPSKPISQTKFTERVLQLFRELAL